MAKKTKPEPKETRYEIEAEYITAVTVKQLVFASTPAKAREEFRRRVQIQEKTGSVRGADRDTRTTHLKISDTREA